MKALVTGASSGIGREIARVLAARGCDLVLTARREERLRALASELSMVRVTILPADLSSREGCRALYRAAQGENIDILVNNAGLGLFGPFDETDLEAELGMLDVNIIAMHMLMKLFLPDLEAKDRGYILNVASSAAFLPGPLLSSYYASKAYVLRLSEAVAEELRRAGSGVRISVLCPGPVQTEFDQVANVCFSAPSLSSRRVAECAVNGMFRGKPVIAPGARMKAVRLAQRLVPDRLLARICWHVQRKKSGT
ncbi:SDR family NAD(P)-dependent oxidoreductase [Intestinimonas butyriciproducens]|uniref:SDR family NAD(P)-dependent oxidoreductase n=1 Tax=Intestinimonas butyriciproducens TaxID=1297617 RepID=UPI003219EAE8